MSKLVRTICATLLASLLCLGGLTACSKPQADPVTVELIVPAEGLDQAIEQQVSLGAEVTLKVTTANPDRIHVHGYELEFDTPAGKPVDEVFTANMAGAYEIESHDAGQIYMKLIVQ